MHARFFQSRFFQLQDLFDNFKMAYEAICRLLCMTCYELQSEVSNCRLGDTYPTQHLDVQIKVYLYRWRPKRAADCGKPNVRPTLKSQNHRTCPVYPVLPHILQDVLGSLEQPELGLHHWLARAGKLKHLVVYGACRSVTHKGIVALPGLVSQVDCQYRQRFRRNLNSRALLSPCCKNRVGANAGKYLPLEIKLTQKASKAAHFKASLFQHLRKEPQFF